MQDKRAQKKRCRTDIALYRSLLLQTDSHISVVKARLLAPFPPHSDLAESPQSSAYQFSWAEINELRKQACSILADPALQQTYLSKLKRWYLSGQIYDRRDIALQGNLALPFYIAEAIRTSKHEKQRQVLLEFDFIAQLISQYENGKLSRQAHFLQVKGAQLGHFVNELFLEAKDQTVKFTLRCHSNAEVLAQLVQIILALNYSKQVERNPNFDCTMGRPPPQPQLCLLTCDNILPPPPVLIQCQAKLKGKRTSAQLVLGSTHLLIFNKGNPVPVGTLPLAHLKVKRLKGGKSQFQGSPYKLKLYCSEQTHKQLQGRIGSPEPRLDWYRMPWAQTHYLEERLEAGQSRKFASLSTADS